MAFGDVNYLAVLAGSAFNMILGTLWYGPLFGKLWLKLIGKSSDEIESKPYLYVLAFVAAYVAGVVLYMVITAAGVGSFFPGLLVGILVWLGIVAAVTLTYSIFEGPKLSVWLIFVGYQLVIFSVLGGLFAVW